MNNSSPKRLLLLALTVLAIHILILLGPLAWLRGVAERQENSEFAVEIMGELLKAEEVGPPERLPDPPAPEPENPPSPEPAPENPPPPEPVPETPPVPEPIPEPDVKLPEAITEFKIPSEPVDIKLPSPPTASSRVKVYREPAPGALRLPKVARRVAPRSGPRNTNSLIPVGTRERGQIRGEPNNVAPGGGKSNAGDDGFGVRVGAFLKLRWNQPPRSLLGDQFPEVLIELSVAADGRVLSSRILRNSGIPAMDESVERLLRTLTVVPRPTDGKTHTQTFVLKTEE